MKKAKPIHKLDTPFFNFTFEPESGRIEIMRANANQQKCVGRSLIHFDRPHNLAARRFGILENAQVSQSPFTDIHGSGTQLLMRSIQPPGLEMTLRVNLYDTQPFLLMRLSVKNGGNEPIHMRQFAIFEAEPISGGKVRLSERGRPLNFFKAGWHDWVYSGLRTAHDRDVRSRLKFIVGQQLFNPTTPIPWRKGEFFSDTWGILTDLETALVAGFVTTADQFGLLYACCRSGYGALSLLGQADGVPLDSGEELDSEWAYLQFVDLPDPDPAAGYVEAVARQMKARLPKETPPAHWTHWYQFFQNITEEKFVANLDAISEIESTIPFRIVQLDDGYQSAWGDWTTCNAKFPRGLADLAGRIREKGFTPGLWLAPFVVDPRSRIAAEHPDWLVRNEWWGRPIKSGYFYQFFGNSLDTTHPAVQDYIRNLMDTIAHRWGFGFVKTDFTYAGALPGKRYNPKMTRAQAFRKGMECVREGLGEETFLLGCGCPFGPAIGIVDAMRIGPDTAPSWTPYLWDMPWATPLIRNERSFASLRNAMRHTLGLSTLHRRWWWNDPDCLMVRDYDTHLNEDEVMSSLTLIGLSGGLMNNSDDLTRLTPPRQKMVSLLTPILSGRGLPLDLLEREMAELYVLEVNTSWQKWKMVALFNWSDHPARRTLDLQRLGYKTGQKVIVFDYWHRKTYLGNENITFDDLPAHACRLLRVCEMEEKTMLVGDTLHITSGAEIEALVSDSNHLHLKTIDLERSAEGELWFHSSFTPHSAVCNQAPLEIEKIEEHIYRVRLAFSRVAEVEIWS